MKPRSQCDRVFVVLADGQPHTMQEIHTVVGFCRLNSRVAELRSRGHGIVCWRHGREYVYQLVSLAGSPASETKYPTQRGPKWVTAAEASGGWDDQADPEQTCDGGDSQEVAPMGSVEVARAEGHDESDGGGDPGNSPSAGQLVLLGGRVRGTTWEPGA